jgi:hypothetical protein
LIVVYYSIEQSNPQRKDSYRNLVFRTRKESIMSPSKEDDVVVDKNDDEPAKKKAKVVDDDNDDGMIAKPKQQSSLTSFFSSSSKKKEEKPEEKKPRRDTNNDGEMKKVSSPSKTNDDGKKESDNAAIVPKNIGSSTAMWNSLNDNFVIVRKPRKRSNGNNGDELPRTSVAAFDMGEYLFVRINWLNLFINILLS